jgi:hypothetical protein
VVPTAVVAELAEGSKHGYDVPAPSTFGWVDVEAAPGAAILPLVTDLGDGERAAIALAASRKSDLLLLDDALARRHAKLLGLSVTGTLGVLLKAKEVGLVPAVAPLVDRFARLGFRVAGETRAAVIKLAGE